MTEMRFTDKKDKAEFRRNQDRADELLRHMEEQDYSLHTTLQVLEIAVAAVLYAIRQEYTIDEKLELRDTFAYNVGAIMRLAEKLKNEQNEKD